MRHRTRLRLALISLLLAFGLIAVPALSWRLVGRHSTTAHAQTGTPCSLATFAGNYGYSVTGTVFLGASGRPEPNGSTHLDVLELGAGVWDGQGGVTITSDISITNGQPVQRTATGTYTVNPDCTGTVTLQFSDSPNPSVTTFVILDGGNESRFVATTPGVAILGLGKRQ